MKEIEQDKFSNLRNMWHQASGMDENYNKVNHNLDVYTKGYCRYFGCGNHLYILTNEEHDRKKLIKIGNQHIHPRLMAQQLAEFMSEFRVVMLDVEIGGMSVFK